FDPFISLGEATLSLTKTALVGGEFGLEIVTTGTGEGWRNGFGFSYPTIPNMPYRLRLPLAGTAGERILIRQAVGAGWQSQVLEFTGLPTFDVVEMTGIAGPQQTQVRVRINSLESGSITFYADEMFATYGQEAATAGKIYGDLLDQIQ